MPKRKRNRKKITPQRRPSIDNARAAPTPPRVRRWKPSTKKARIALGFALGCAVIAVGSALFALVFIHSEPAPFSARINPTGDVSVVFKTQQDSGISPACGCVKPESSERWRGLAFVAKRFQFQTRGPSDHALYYFTSPTPGFTDPLTTNLAFDAFIATYVIPGDNQKSIGALLDLLVDSSSAAAGLEYIATARTDNITHLSLAYPHSLTIKVVDRMPFAAWLPATNSTVHLRYARGEFPSDPATTRIEEEFGTGTTGASNGVPAVDVIGSVAIALEGEFPTFWTSAAPQIEHVPPPESRADGFFPKPNSSATTNSFSDSNSVADAASDSVQQWIQSVLTDSTIRKLHLLFMIPPFALRLSGAALDDTTWAKVQSGERSLLDVRRGRLLPVPHEAGIAALELESPFITPEEYSAIYDSLRNGDQVLVERPGPTLMAMQFRYPPLPPTRGVSIFGSVDRLHFDRASGSVLVGNKVTEMPVPVTFEASQLQQERRPVFRPAIPLQLEVEDSTTTIELRATGRISVDGKTLSSRADAFGGVLEPLSWIVSIVGALGSVIAMIISFLQRQGVSSTKR